MKKRIISILLVATMGIGLVACGNKGNETDASASQDADTISSASPMGDVLASGGEIIDSVNAKEIQLVPNSNGSTRADINFVLGSAREGSDEAAIDKVPAYKAYYLEHPARLVIEITDLTYWSYESTLSVPEDSLLYGIFKQTKSKTNEFSIVFQLKKDCDVTISESKNVLSIDFAPRANQDETKYHYVMADAQNAFNGSQINGGDLFSTLSSDLTNIVLISKPYKTEKEAEDDMASLLSQNPVLTEDNTFVVSLEGDDLPSYGDSSKFASVYSKEIIQRNGVKEILPVVMPDGIYLCSKDDGSMLLFAKQEDMGNTDDPDDVGAQKLWTMDQNKKLRPLLDSEFTTVDKAAFSPDGRRIAFIENTLETSPFYLYDLDTNELTILSEEQFGNVTSYFVWDALGTALYAISGSNGDQQLLKYDFTIPDEDSRITAVVEEPIGEGDLAFLNGDLYFTNVTDDDREVIYKIKPEGGLKTEFAEGGSFRLSPNGNEMAILRLNLNEISALPADAASESTDLNTAASGSDATTSENGEEVGVDNIDSQAVILVSHDMISGEETIIYDENPVIDAEWASDGKLYYMISISDDFSSEYSFMLRCFDPATNQSVDIAEVMSSTFAVTPDPDVLYITLINQDDESPIQATYKFTVN